MSQTDRLGEVLAEVGVITPEQLDQATALHQIATDGTTLRDILIGKGFATEAQIIKGIGVKDQISYFEDIEPFLNPEAAGLLTERFCRKYQVVPLMVQDGHLMLAMINPYDLSAKDDIASHTQLSIQPVISTRKAIVGAIAKMYHRDEGDALETTISKASKEIEDVSEAEKEEYTSFEVAAPPEESGYVTAAVVDEAPVIKLTNQIMLGAINQKASDIHIEPRVDKLAVRYRMDGVLSEAMSLPRALSPAIVSRIKIMSKLDISEMRKPQDGRIRLKLTDRMVDFRVSILPLVTGEKVVMRILDKDQRSTNLDQMGMPPDILAQFKPIIRHPNGIILVTGPTGSGKTTTLYAALESVKDDAKNIATLEDPVEYQVTGINQVTLNSAIGMTFATGLRSLLRQDPDILLVGEIRDLETAKISIQAALTGHLVFSTLHTNSACGSISRLLDMDTEPFLLSSALRGVLAQRLIRLLCTYCRKVQPADAHMLDRLGLPESKGPYTFYGPVGCPKCSQTGYRRRVGVFECLTITREIQEKIQVRASDQDILDTARKQGFRTMFENGLERLLKGETSFEELLRVVVVE